MEGPLIAPPAGAPLPTRPAANAEIDEIRRVAQEFESVFLAEMLAPMFEALDADGLGGGGLGERMFRPMLVERYAESIARAGGVGIAAQIIAELTRMQTIQPEAVDGADR